MSNDQFAFIGTYTNLGSEGIYTLRLNGDTGELSQVSVTTGLENPSFVFSLVFGVLYFNSSVYEE